MKRIAKTAAMVIILAAVSISFMSGAFAADIKVRGDIIYPNNSGAVTSASVMNTANNSVPADFTVSDYRSLVRTIESQYVARVPSFTVQYAASESDIEAASGTAMEDALKYDDPATKSDLDYLEWNMSQCQYQATISTSSAGAVAVFTFTQTFLDTAAGEAFVNADVADILKGLNVGSASAYTKIKAVHDYIVAHVDYDQSLVKYTAYDALKSGQAVCQGYALLTYKMLSELGVPVRIISGQGNGGAHAWNIVKIGGYWYNLDVTWDDTAATTKYFLKNDAGFSDHTRDSTYATSDFYTKYPMSPTDYNPANDNTDTPSSWAKDGVNSFVERGVVPAALKSGYQSSITRAEFTALVGNVYEYAKGPYTLKKASPFTDISGSPYILQISKGFELGIIGGTSATTFMPDGTLTREQCAKIIAAAAGVINRTPVSSNVTLPFGDTGAIDGWALDYVRYAFENGLMTGTGANFEPLGVLSREQAMVIAERMIEKYHW